jgi:serine/threonine protein kinase
MLRINHGYASRGRDSLGPYETLAPIGAGGMAEVYRAHDPRMGRDVAVRLHATAAAGTRALRPAVAIVGSSSVPSGVPPPAQRAELRRLAAEAFHGDGLSRPVR